jgi:hypothetical protein
LYAPELFDSIKKKNGRFCKSGLSGYYISYLVQSIPCKKNCMRFNFTNPIDIEKNPKDFNSPNYSENASNQRGHETSL